MLSLDTKNAYWQILNHIQQLFNTRQVKSSRFSSFLIVSVRKLRKETDRRETRVFKNIQKQRSRALRYISHNSSFKTAIQTSRDSSVFECSSSYKKKLIGWVLKPVGKATCELQRAFPQSKNLSFKLSTGFSREKKKKSNMLVPDEWDVLP